MDLRRQLVGWREAVAPWRDMAEHTAKLASLAFRRARRQSERLFDAILLQALHVAAGARVQSKICRVRSSRRAGQVIEQGRRRLARLGAVTAASARDARMRLAAAPATRALEGWHRRASAWVREGPVAPAARVVGQWAAALRREAPARRQIPHRGRHAALAPHRRCRHRPRRPARRLPRLRRPRPDQRPDLRAHHAGAGAILEPAGRLCGPGLGRPAGLRRPRRLSAVRADPARRARSARCHPARRPAGRRCWPSPPRLSSSG